MIDDAKKPKIDNMHTYICTCRGTDEIFRINFVIMYGPRKPI